jgi:hypothetical protein
MSFEKVLLKNRKKLYDSIVIPEAAEMRKQVEESNARDIAKSTILNQPKPDKIFIKPLPKGILFERRP